MSTALDVTIGIVFLYLLLALIVTTIQELIATVLGSRAKSLYDAIEGMLRSGNAPGAIPLVQRVYDHPLIRNLAKPNFDLAAKISLPSYIPSKTFALVLVDVLRKESASKVTGAANLLAAASELVEHLPEGDLKASLGLLVDEAEGVEKTIDERAALVSQRIEDWFNDRMARVSGWYKREAQKISLAIGFALTVALNASTIHVATALWTDPTARATVVLQAQDAARQPIDSKASPGALRNSGLPIGWGKVPEPAELPVLVIGWVMTALAVSLGSSFWFDLLGRVLQIRGTGARVSPATGAVDPSDA